MRCFAALLLIGMALVAFPARGQEAEPPRLEAPSPSDIRLQLEQRLPLDGPRLTLLNTYRLRRLHRGPLRASPTGQPTAQIVSWGVFDGGGAPLPAWAFAEQVGDDAVLQKLIDEEKRSNAGLGLGIGLGSGGLAGGILLVGWALAQEGPSSFDYVVDGSVDVPSFAAAEEAHRQRITPPIVVGSLLTLVSVNVVALSFVPWSRARGKRQFVSRYWSPEEADEWIGRHNRKVAEELGVSEEEAGVVELLGE